MHNYMGTFTSIAIPFLFLKSRTYVPLGTLGLRNFGLEQMRLEAQAGRMKSENPNSLLPALADLYESSRARVDDFITVRFGKLHHRTHYVDGGHNGGYVTGYNAGDKVGLHRQVSGKRAHRRLTHG
jgi:hypothetical protein